ncbi:MAG TPA: hypothetical protein VE988_09555, partial [Gemmataceae bacterium]|nr:hypothetical protein [Gemmataceae bacterium]
MSRRISFWQSGAVVLGLLAFASRQGLPQQQDQGPDALANCWQDLAAEDAGLAFRATWRLVQNPQSAVKLLGQHLTPASPPDSPKIQAWLEDLQSTKYAVREKATKELELQAELAEPLLRKALETKPDLEMRRRVELLLSKLTQTVISTEKLIRAVEILEILGNAEATQLLQRLAKGFPGHRQTREAQESLQRLKQRAPVPEHWLTWTKAPPAAADKADALPFGARTRLGTTLFRQHGN